MVIILNTRPTRRFIALVNMHVLWQYFSPLSYNYLCSYGIDCYKTQHSILIKPPSCQVGCGINEIHPLAKR